MGEIVVTAKLENTEDRGSFKRGFHDEASIRATSIDAIVDTGAAMLMLPQNIVERLGLEVQRTAIVTYADDRREERPIAGPVTIELCGRFMHTSCIVGPPLSEALTGQIVLQELDLIADCPRHSLHPRVPDYPLLSLR